MTLNSSQTLLFKQAMGNYPTGISIVTALDEDKNPIGLTINSLASVSIDPLLILWSIDKNVSTYHTFKQIDKFAINILSSGQANLANLFASKEENRFDYCSWVLSKNELPIINDSLATFECETYKNVEMGDHTTLFG